MKHFQKKHFGRYRCPSGWDPVHNEKDTNKICQVPKKTKSSHTNMPNSDITEKRPENMFSIQGLTQEARAEARVLRSHTNGNDTKEHPRKKGPGRPPKK